MFLPLQTTRDSLLVKRYSIATTSANVRIADLREMLPMPEIAGYVICEYDNKWWLALVMRPLIDSEEVEVRSGTGLGGGLINNKIFPMLFVCFI